MVSRPVVRSAIPQRLRFECPAVYRHAALAAGVSAALATLPNVRAASANPLTGRVLVEFETPVADLDTVLDEIARAATQAQPLDTHVVHSGPELA